MKPLRRWCALMLIALAAGPSLSWAEPPGQKSGAKTWLLDRSLTLTPAAAPVPALKYRLLPLYSELKEGNAVPIYLRLIFERNDAWKKMLVDKPTKWNALPLNQIPISEAQHFLKELRTFLQQIELGARRKHADWNYTLDQGDVISILLPDAQTMRSYAPALVLKARVELAQGHFSAAAHTIETGLAFSRHAGSGPFLINVLVGIAIARQFENTILDFIEAPNSPNLYWSLSVLPQPLLSIRHGLDFEQKTFVMEFPVLQHLDLSRSPEQWAADLKRIRKEVKGLIEGPENGPRIKFPANTGPDDPAERSPDFPAAKRCLTEHLGIPAAKVESMAPAHVLLLWILDEYRAYRDSFFKGAYLPYPESRRVVAEAIRQLEAAPNTEAQALAHTFLPAIGKVGQSENRLVREFAALRVLEAIRLYAAAHDGQLPEKLSDIQEVPVPADPGTDKPFEYHKDGPTAVLISRIPGEPQNITGLRYRLSIRQK